MANNVEEVRTPARRSGQGAPAEPGEPPAAPTSLRCVLPQILSCVAAGTFNFCEGLSFSFSSSLIPQLQEPGSEIPVTLEQGVLLGSIMVIAMCLGTISTTFFLERLGRLNTIRVCAVPFAVGWFLVATAASYEQILIGRIISGFGNSLGINGAVVFTTEVASSNVRGSLNAVHPTIASGGMVAMYVLGAAVDWRTSSWVCGVSPVVTLGLMFLFCYESPAWLVSKGRHEAALRSLRAYARKNDSEFAREKLPQLQLDWLIQKHLYEESQAQNKKPWYLSIVDVFRTSAGLKPLCMLTVIFVAQNFTGIYITLFYAAPFFQEMGVQVDAFQAAIYIGLVRFFMGMVAVVLIRGVGVRPLVLGSSMGMAACMAVSGYFTLHPEHGLQGWVAVAMVLLYVAFSCCGLLTVPWTMTAELFPDRLRDAGQCLSVFIADIIMFAALQLYPTIEKALQIGDVTGSVGLQWFFAAVALANMVFVVLFLPETRGKSLQEIEDHYRHNTLWLGRRRTRAPEKEARPDVPDVPTLSARVDLDPS
ncbi:hypothetical protein ONE63_011015 [Megalurothrips usitatus]|uniref:Major facilitator superfamily (MFS) profile domain-containing protein n=1 Tax=Megalurothrips usitatus TaxID=439358 RepID=A0AAV7XM79_9NEOP|nr:hypothetical protein ONE63_011015 [Megalurothrips usitatus]